MREYPPDCWIDPRCEVRPSPIRGSGVFALQTINKGEVVQTLGGTTLNEQELLATLAAATSYVNTIQVDENLHLITHLPKDKDGLIFSMNHSCDSNLWMSDEITLLARRDIGAGDEITVDYALFTTIPGEILEVECSCGSPRCRHSITADDWRLSEIQEQYRDHFSPFINRRIANMRQIKAASLGL